MAESVGASAVRVLVVGAPRSGTTWVAESLRHGAGCRYIQEPDNERHAPAALHAKRGLGRFPILGPADAAPAYESLWRAAFQGGTPRPFLTDTVARGMLRLSAPATRERAISDGTAPLWLRVSSALAARKATASGEPVVIKSVHSALSIEWIAA